MHAGDLRMSRMLILVFGLVMNAGCMTTPSKAYRPLQSISNGDKALLHFVLFDNPPFYIPESEVLNAEGIFNRLLLLGSPEGRFVVHLMKENDDIVPWKSKSHCSYIRRSLQNEERVNLPPGDINSVPLFFDLNIAIVVPKKTRNNFFRDFPESIKTSRTNLRALLAKSKYKIVKKHGLEGGIPLELAEAINAYPKTIFAEGFHSTTTPTQMLWEGDADLQLGFQDQVSYYESTKLTGTDNFSFIEIEELQDNRVLVAFKCSNLSEEERKLFAAFNRNIATARATPQYQDIFSKWWRLKKDQQSIFRDLTHGKYDRLLSSYPQ